MIKKLAKKYNIKNHDCRSRYFTAREEENEKYTNNKALFANLKSKIRDSIHACPL